MYSLSRCPRERRYGRRRNRIEGHERVAFDHRRSSVIRKQHGRITAALDGPREYTAREIEGENHRVVPRRAQGGRPYVLFLLTGHCQVEMMIEEGESNRAWEEAWQEKIRS